MKSVYLSWQVAWWLGFYQAESDQIHSQECFGFISERKGLRKYFLKGLLQKET